MKGTITNIPLDDEGRRKGFGFIRGDDGADYFFHATDLSKISRRFIELSTGEIAEFTPADGKRGKDRAADVIA